MHGHPDLEAVQLRDALRSFPLGHQYFVIRKLLRKRFALEAVVVYAVFHDSASCPARSAAGAVSSPPAYSGSICQPPSSATPTRRAARLRPCAMAPSTTSASAGVRLLPRMKSMLRAPLSTSVQRAAMVSEISGANSSAMRLVAASRCASRFSLISTMPERYAGGSE